MDGIKKNTGGSGHHYSATTHRTLQKSSTLNRKFVKKPAKAAVAPKTQITSAAMRAAEAMRRRQLIAANDSRAKVQAPARAPQGGQQAQQAQTQSQPQPQRAERADSEKIAVKVVKHPAVQVANARVAARKADAPRHLSAQELKNQAIQQALRRVATMNGDQTTTIAEQMDEAITKKKPFWQKRKLAIALAMSAVSIALLGYLVHLNLPDLSVRVAAMQTGIDAAYPSYIPKDYRLDGLVSEKDGKIVMNFSGKDNTRFTLSEEKSNWDSSAVRSNFVDQNWGKDYEELKDQGLTIFVSGSNAVWVNGGILYHVEDSHSLLTKQQLHDIAVSL